MNYSVIVFSILLFVYVTSLLCSTFDMSVGFTLQPFCSLHLQLQLSENPYLSGTISTKSSAPGIIVATGTTYTSLTNYYSDYLTFKKPITI